MAKAPPRAEASAVTAWVFISGFLLVLALGAVARFANVSTVVRLLCLLGIAGCVAVMGIAIRRNQDSTIRRRDER